MNDTAEDAGDKAGVCLLVLCGLPGAGKTTLARELAFEAGTHEVEARLVCFDELGCQPASHGVSGGGSSGGSSMAEELEGFSPEAWRLARQQAFRMLQSELGRPCSCQQPPQAHQEQQQQHERQQPAPRVQQQLPPGQQRRWRLVIADDNMQYRSMRWQCYALAREARAAIVLLHVRCDEQLAQQRNAARPPSQQVPAAVISRMATQFEDPGSSSDSNSSIGGGFGSSSSHTNSSGSSSGPCWERGCQVEWDSARGVVAGAEVVAPVADARQSLGQQHGAAAAPGQRSVAVLWQQVWQRWGLPAPPPHDAAGAAAAKAAAQAATAASLAHAVDGATRQVLTQCLQQLPSADKQRKAAAAVQLNAARRQLLQGLREQLAAGEEVDDVAAATAQWIASYQQQCRDLLDGL